MSFCYKQRTKTQYGKTKQKTVSQIRKHVKIATEEKREKGWPESTAKLETGQNKHSMSIEYSPTITKKKKKRYCHS